MIPIQKPIPVIEHNIARSHLSVDKEAATYGKIVWSSDQNLIKLTSITSSDACVRKIHQEKIAWSTFHQNSVASHILAYENLVMMMIAEVEACHNSPPTKL